MTTNRHHLVTTAYAARIAAAVFAAGVALGAAASHAPELIHLASSSNACATMTISACAELDTSSVTDLRGEPVPVGDLNEIVGVAIDDGAPADLVACWIANGAVGDPTDGSETLYASRLVIDSCNPIGWVQI